MRVIVTTVYEAIDNEGLANLVAQIREEAEGDKDINVAMDQLLATGASHVSDFNPDNPEQRVTTSYRVVEGLSGGVTEQRA